MNELINTLKIYILFCYVLESFELFQEITIYNKKKKLFKSNFNLHEMILFT